MVNYPFKVMHLTNIISGQTSKTWTLHIVNDNRYEGTEDFQLRLSDPVLGILEYPFISNFFITDPEDGKFMQYMYWFQCPPHLIIAFKFLINFK